jgi:thiosulfate/3-mercaptopyruvate sulfurtransferase
MNDRVVSVERLAGWLEDPETSVVDVRDAWEYDGIGHVPGAVNVPFDRFRADEHGAAEAGRLPGADAFADLAGEAGIANGDRIVAYDDTHGVFAARFLVTAELYGHDPSKLHLLDGDYSLWSRSEPTTTEAISPTPTSYAASFRTDGPLVDRAAIAAAVDDPEALLVDTREGWEYEEGHIPGAVRLDWRELVDADARTIRPEPALRSLLNDRGIVPEKRVVLYCNTARRISHTYTVLRALEYPDLSFYEGSLTEWERAGGEIERGGAADG